MLLNELELNVSDNAQKRNIPVAVENPVVKRRKGHPQTAHIILNSVEVNQHFLIKQVILGVVLANEAQV